MEKIGKIGNYRQLKAACCYIDVIPYQTRCKSHFSPILWSGLETDLKRRRSGPVFFTFHSSLFVLFRV